MIFADGKMYMGSQSFHDLKWEIDSLPTFRGSHLFAFDTTADTWSDLSAALPEGVVLCEKGVSATCDRLVRYVFTSSDTIAAGDRLVIARSAAGFTARFGFEPDVEADISPLGGISPVRLWIVPLTLWVRV